MVVKIFFIALSCIFIAQIHRVQCEDQEPAPSEAPSENDLSNDITNKATHAILRHLRIAMTNPVSASVIKDIVTSARVMLTDEVGQKNVQHFIDFIVDLLMDPNMLPSIQTFHGRLVQLADTGPGAPIVLETVALSTYRFLNAPQLLEASDAFVEGINLILDGMTEEKLRTGINRLRSMTQLAFYFMPMMGIDFPKPQKRKKSKSKEPARSTSLQSRKGKSSRKKSD